MIKMTVLNGHEEVWKDIAGFEGLYQVSNLGRVKSLDRIIDAKSKTGTPCKRTLKGKILKLGKDGHGYFHINLCGKGKRTFPAVHRLVAEAFLPKIEGKEYINHIDSDYTNNHIENLEWCTSSENNLHGWQQGNRVAKNKKPVEMLSVDGKSLMFFESIAEAARSTGICEESIRACCNQPHKSKTAGGFKWKKVQKDDS